jgi:ankyrin repeat protein
MTSKKKEENKQAIDKKTELCYASRDGHVAWVERLRQQGLDVAHCRVDDDGMSSILIASQYGHLELLDYLLNLGADPNDMENYGNSCLMAAACYGRPCAFEKLISAGASVNRNPHILDMMTSCFCEGYCSYGKEYGMPGFKEGNVIRTLELLLDAGFVGIGKPVEAIENLRKMKVGELDILRERDGLIALLEPFVN